MSKYRDLTGKRFGHLTVIKRSHRKDSKNRSWYWVCQCDCGRYLVCRTDNLKSGHTTKCTDCREKKGGITSVFLEGVVEV